MNFIRKLAETKPQDANRIVCCLTSDIGLVYYNDDFEVKDYIAELKQIIANESLNSRESQIAYDLLADFESFKR